MTPLPPEKAAEFESALFKGNKIEAIKIYRQVTGADLREAKTAVEKIEQEWRGSQPEKFAAAASRKGCSTRLAAVGLFGAGVVWWLR
jgi:ribosomal protein L7/L12